MKKLICLIVVTLFFSACTPEDLPKQHFEILPVEYYTIPESFVFQNTYEIKLFYKRPNDCHALGGIYFDRYFNMRTVAIQSIVYDRNDCVESQGEIYETSFQFFVSNLETYTFRFYKGTDDEGNPIYDYIDIPVTNN